MSTSQHAHRQLQPQPGDEPVTGPIRCSRCGTLANLTDRFCGGCGAARPPIPALGPTPAVVQDDPAAVTAPIVVPAPRTPRHLARPGPRTAAAAGPAHPRTHATPPSAPPPTNPPPSAPRPPDPVAGWDTRIPEWVTPAVAGAACLAQLGAALAGFPTESVNGADFSTLAVATLPAFGFAAAFTALAVAAYRRRPAAHVYGVVLALAVITSGLFSEAVTSPGPLVCMLAAAVAVLPALSFASGGRPGPTGARAGAETPLLWWLVGATAAAALYGFVVSHEVDGGTNGQVVGGVLFVGLAVAVALIAVQPPPPPVARWTVVGLWLLDAVAVSLADAGGRLWWPLLALHLGLGVVLAWPLLARTTSGSVLNELVGKLSRLPQIGVLAGAGAAVALTGILVAFTGTESTAGYAASDSSLLGSSITPLAIGVLALGAACTPTMTPLWRGGLVAGAVFSFFVAWDGFSPTSDSESTFAWSVAAPVLLLGASAWGYWSNRRSGATASLPGWIGPGQLPRMISVPFVAPPTAGARSQVCLELSSALDPATLLDAVRRATAVRGNWFRVYGDTVTVTGGDPASGVLGLAIGGTCTFRAHVTTNGARRRLRVGGMDRWTKSRWYFEFIIPISPAKVEGFRMYKVFLATVASEVNRLDPSAQPRIGRPTTA